MVAVDQETDERGPMACDVTDIVRTVSVLKRRTGHPSQTTSAAADERLVLVQRVMHALVDDGIQCRNHVTIQLNLHVDNLMRHKMIIIEILGHDRKTLAL